MTAPVGHTVDIKGDAEARKYEDSGDAIKVYAGPGCVYARVSFVTLRLMSTTRDSSPALKPPKSDPDKSEV